MTYFHCPAKKEIGIFDIFIIKYSMNFAIYVIVILSLTLDFFTVLVCLLNGQMKKMDG